MSDAGSSRRGLFRFAAQSALKAALPDLPPAGPGPDDLTPGELDAAGWRAYVTRIRDAANAWK